MFRRAAGIPRKRLLSAVPCLNPAVRWEPMDSGQLMAVFPRYSGRLARMVSRLLALPETGQLLLDDVGSSVVQQIDNRRSLADLIAFVAHEYKLSRKESEVSLLAYMNTLGRRRLIGFRLEPGEPSDGS